jgi:hypothetical protein
LAQREAGYGIFREGTGFQEGLKMKLKVLGYVLMCLSVLGMVALGPVALVIQDFRKMG